MRFDIITIFPGIVKPYLTETILARAIAKKFIKVNILSPRQFATDAHRTVDDRPYGGGPGMVMMFGPLAKTVKKVKSRNSKVKSRVVLLSPTGKQFDQKMARKFSKLDQLILISGRYEGVDARIEKIIDEKISIGPYVLSGGELPALIFTEAVSRLIPGVLGKQQSLLNESFDQEGYLEYPHYTRPEVVRWKGKELKVPQVLLSGHHAEIEKWRQKNSQ